MSPRSLLTLVLALTAPGLHADPIAVRQMQGLTHGFLTVHAEDGAIIARGELSQVARGDRVTAHLIYRFNDGSIDDETTTYTQRGTFHLLRDHHIQKGPYFPKPIDYLVDTVTGNVTSRSLDKDGKEKVEVEHTEMPPDTYNGVFAATLLNAPPTGPEFKIGMIAPTGKGRHIKLAITPAGQGTFRTVGLTRKANIFRLKAELGGVTGAIAPIVGKQPADTFVWVIAGEAPGIVRQVGQLYEGGPIVSIEVAGATFPKSDAQMH